MFRLYRIAFGPTRKSFRIGLLFTHKNGNFGAISVTERRFRTWSVTHGIGSLPNFGAHIRTVAEVNNLERGQESTETEVTIQE